MARKSHTEPNAEATVEVCGSVTKGQGQGDTARNDGDCMCTTSPMASQYSTAILTLFKAKCSLSPRFLSQGQVRETASGN